MRRLHSRSSAAGICSHSSCIAFRSRSAGPDDMAWLNSAFRFRLCVEEALDKCMTACEAVDSVECIFDIIVSLSLLRAGHPGIVYVGGIS